MFKNIFIIIFGIGLLIFGANLLVKGANKIAQKLKIPDIIIGLTIVAIGTSLPELIVTIISATKDSTELIIGNVLGSNISNLLLILGIISIIKPVKTDIKTRKIHIPVLILSTLLVFFMGLGFLGTKKLIITKIDGLVLIFIGIIYYIYTISEKLKNENESEIEDKDINIITSIINILIGSILLKYGGDFVVDSSINIAKDFGISEKIIGLTIIGLGTSLPELVTSIMAILKQNEDLAIGNIIGSCIMNLLFILGIGAVISPIYFGYGFNQTIFLLIASTILIWLYSIAEQNKKINRHNGIVLVSIFILHFVKLFI